MSWSGWDAQRVTGPNWTPGAAPPEHRRASRTSPAPDRGGTRSTEFRDVLRSRLQKPLRWSRHAEDRLRSTGVNLRPEDMRSIQGAVDSLAARGARDALVVYGQLALVVSVVNRTVITAATPDRWQDGIFTNIDGAALVQQRDESGAGLQGVGRLFPTGTTGEAPGPRNDGSGPDTGRFGEQ